MAVNVNNKIAVIGHGTSNFANTTEKYATIDGVTGVGLTASNPEGWTGLMGALNTTDNDTESSIIGIPNMALWLKANSNLRSWDTSSDFLATGGTKTTVGNYTYHAFTSGTDTFQVVSGSAKIEVLAVAGGGGGGGGYGAGGGGGAGGLVYTPRKSVAVGNYNIVVGAGGTGGLGNGGNVSTSHSSHGRQGGNSSFEDIAAIGGGGGNEASYYPSDFIGGGSGGGAGDYYIGEHNPGASRGGVATQGNSGGGMGFGNPGGSRGPGGPTPSEDGVHADPHEGAGGGGAGGTSTGGTSALASNGGIGLYFPQFTYWGSPAGWFAGGGGGGYYSTTTNPQTNAIGSNTGYKGGGGLGTKAGGSVPVYGSVGVANSGGGGGGGSGNNSNNVAAPNGGSGIVLVRYLMPGATEISGDDIITVLEDSSGNGRHAAGIAQFKINQMNGQPVLRFTTDQGMSSNHNFPAPCSVFTVCRYYPGGTNVKGRVITGKNNNWMFGHYGTMKNSCYFEGWVFYPDPCWGGSNYWSVYSGVIPGSGNSLAYVNGNMLAANAAGIAGPNGIALNQSPYADNSDCEVAEVIVFSRAVTSEERVRIENYLKKKYGLATLYSDLYETPAALKVANPSYGNGLYFLYPRHLPDAIQVYCDLTSDGESGWVLVENTGPKYTTTSATDWAGSSPINIYPTQTAFSKLSDKLINLLRKRKENSIIKLTRPNNPTFLSYPLYFRGQVNFSSDAKKSPEAQGEDCTFLFYTSYNNARNLINTCGGLSTSYGSAISTWSNITGTGGGTQWRYIHSYMNEGSISDNTYEGNRSERQALIWVQWW